VFTKLKEKVKIIYPDSYSKWYVDFMIGGLSAVGQIIAYPFDVLRKRRQGQKLLLDRGEIDRLRNYRGLMHDIYSKEGGIIGFYKGLSLNMIKAPLSLATVWMVKNKINRLLDNNYDF
jgi:solute carrier family 25 protein 42